MKNNILIIVCVALTSISCKAQSILPVEKLVDYRNSNEGIPESVTYVKDINGLLNKYVGTWIGTYQGKNYEFRVKKIRDDSFGVSIDELEISYIIKDSSRKIIEDTTKPNSGTYIIGAYLAKNKHHYVLNYYGTKGDCGQNGDVFISVLNRDSNKMWLKLSVDGEMSEDCTAYAGQVLPTDGIILTKQ